jgi:hypothetical protein
MELQRSLDHSGLPVPLPLQFSRMSDGHLVALWSAAFSVFHVNRLAGSKQRPQLRSRLSNGLARATPLMVMLTNDSASRYVEKTGCGLRRLRDAFGFQQLDSTHPESFWTANQLPPSNPSTRPNLPRLAALHRCGPNTPRVAGPPATTLRWFLQRDAFPLTNHPPET